MDYKRAERHSGLTYRRTCETCKNVVEYQDSKLEFCEWYPEGFVYCPTCKNPLRHDESYAVDREPEPAFAEEACDTAPAAPVFTEAPVDLSKPAAPAAPVSLSKPREASAASVSLSKPAAEPEYRPDHAAPAAAPKKYVLKEKMPVAAIILMGLAVLCYMLKILGYFSYMRSIMSIFGNLMSFSGCSLMFIGMLLHKKKGQLLTGIGALTIAFNEIISIITSFGYTDGFTILLEILFIGAYTVAGLYYLLKKPALGMPVKLIVFCLDLTAYLLYMSRSIISIFRYSDGMLVFVILWNIFLAVSLMIYNPFKRRKA